MESKIIKILRQAYSLKLRNVILFLNQGLIFIFYKWLYSQRCFNVAQRCENLHWKWQRCLEVVWCCSNQRWNGMRRFDVVQRCKFQRWHAQHCFNVGLTLCDVTTSYQHKNNLETKLKCLLGYVYWIEETTVC